MKNIKHTAERVNYSETELKYRDHLISMISNAGDTRDQEHDEFDGQTYKEYYESNAKAANAHIKPKNNEEEVRITTGITKEKTTSIHSALLNFNYTPSVVAYDSQDVRDVELGMTQTALIKKSREIESPSYEEKRIWYYKELLDQGSVGILEMPKEWSIPEKVANFNFDVEGTPKFSWTEKGQMVSKQLSSDLICGLSLYLGNIKTPFISEQPFVVVRHVRTRAQAQAMYGNWERWNNVPSIMTRTADDYGDVAFGDWVLENEQDENYIEELHFYDMWNNNFMIMLNGVMMFPAKMEAGRFSTMPLSSINGVVRYPVAYQVLDPIPNFAYGKSIPSKTKVDQAVMDDFIKSAIIKTRQSFTPPMANNTGQSLDRSVFFPGKMTDGIKAEKLKPLVNHTGLNSSELGMIQLLESFISKKSVSPVFEGQSAKGKQTAFEIQQLQRQSMMKMGLPILAVMLLEKQLGELRVYSIIKNWAAKGNRFEVEDSIDGSGKGVRIIEFSDQLPSGQQIQAEEDLLEEIRGTKVRKQVLSPKLLKKHKLKWHVIVNPTEKDSSILKQALFEDSIAKAINIFAPLGKKLNVDYLADRWAVNQNEDPKQYWAQDDVQQVAQIKEVGVQADINPQIASAISNSQSSLNKPSLNSLANNV